ncbi:gp202 [Bacillus phage G]|uniref:Gp202 n=1 Tax=Bacillus phage G TaxID=2884420 RepID=G3MBR8_9CAUD|nr:gp202 [Bacillus phage G]AEO93461.1 gp202 [Bacillus phage G]
MSFKKIGTIFDKYLAGFPVDKTVSLIHGENGTGKTKVLEKLIEYYTKRGENVIYFPDDRFFQLTADEVESVLVMSAIGEETNIFKKLDMKINTWDYENKEGTFINSGNLQIVNFVGSIMLAPKPSIVIIDNIEKSLHISKQDLIVGLLKSLKNTKKLIAVTYSPSIISDHQLETLHIKNCVNLRDD